MFSSLGKKIKKSTKRIDELKAIKDRELTPEEEEELRSLTSKRDKLKITLRGKIFRKVTEKIVVGIVSIVTTFFTTLMTMGTVLMQILLIVVLLITIMSGAISTIVNSGIDFIPGNGTGGTAKPGTPGARYVFNNTDLNMLSTDYQKNLYILMWLWTNVKDMSGGAITIPVPNALGEIIYEYGTNFFKINESGYDNGNLISDYACGFPTVASSTQVCQGLYQCNSKDFNADVLRYWGNFGYSSLEEVTNKAWEGIRDTSKSLPALEGSDVVIYSYWNDAKSSNDYRTTVYDAGYQVMYAGYINGFYSNALDKNTGKGHAYKDFYEQACQRYSLNSTDVNVKNWFLGSLAYVFHAGAANSFFTSETNRVQAMNAIFDYLGYLYTNYYSNGDWTLYNLDTAGNWGSPDLGNNLVLNCAYDYSNVVAVAHSAYGGGGNPYGVSSSVPKMTDWQGNSVIQNNMASLWYNSLDGDRKAEADILGKAFGNDSSVITCMYPGVQGIYAHLAGWATSLSGNSRANVVFDSLQLDWTLDAQGYICYASAGIPVTTVGYNPAIAVDKFDASKPSYWQKDWFQTIDESEWSLPIDFGSDGMKSHVSSLYGVRDFGGGAFHRGMDMLYANANGYLSEGAYDKIPIYAIHDGTITNITLNNPSAGNYFMYSCTWRAYNKETKEWGYKTGQFICMHMSKISEGLAVGDTIKKGQIIGFMGNTGGVATHLHFQMATMAIPYISHEVSTRNIATELPFFTWLNGYEGYVVSGTDGRLTGKPLELGWSNADGTDADVAMTSD